MKKKIVSFIAIVGLLAMSFIMFQSSNGSNTAVAEELKQFGTISVTGEGEITIQPDVAYIQVGVETTGKTAQAAYDANSQQFQKLVKVLKDMKVSDADVKTTSFNTYPEYQWTEKTQELKGYRTQQMIQITYRDLDNIGSLLDQLAAAGANRIHGVQFGTEKLEEYKLQALDKAMENARNKADRLVAHTGSKIHGVVSISEGGAYYQPIYNGVGVDYAVGVAEDRAYTTQIYSGEIKVRATVSVTYKY